MRAIRIAVGLLAAAPALLAGQVKNMEEGEAILGIVSQNDVRKETGVRLSPVGLNIGFIVQPVMSHRRLSVVEQLSFYPIAHYERQMSPFGTPFAGRMNPLVLNALWMRLSTHEPETSGQNVYFAGAGLGVAISTPRDGTKATGMLAVGMRRWFARQVGLEVSLQCNVQKIGNTLCQLPVTTVWPFR